MTADGFYRNVVTIPLDVKPNHSIFLRIKADQPVDIVIAKDDGSALAHKDRIMEGELGPYPTDKRKSMGIILGVFRGDKATAELEVWMEKK